MKFPVLTQLSLAAGGLRKAWWVGLLLAAAGLTAKDSPPTLLSTTGGAAKPAWSNLAELRAAAEKGDAAAQLELGTMHEFGRDMDENPAEARKLYTQAARSGLPEADFRLGRLLSEGLGGPADAKGAYNHYLRAAWAGLPLAQYNVGAMLASARGVRRDYVEGLAWIIVATRDPEVDPDGEKKLRERLSRRPQDIAAAELRAIAIQHEVEHRRNQPPGVGDPPAVEARRPPFMPEGQPARPQIEIPTGPMPDLKTAPDLPPPPPPPMPLPAPKEP